jgi:NADH dehydrogenase/NADH:ubiquinone oxidoreductase subunit G
LQTFDWAKNKMKVTIDGQAIEVEPGTTILQAAR